MAAVSAAGPARISGNDRSDRRSDRFGTANVPVRAAVGCGHAAPRRSESGGYARIAYLRPGGEFGADSEPAAPRLLLSSSATVPVVRFPHFSSFPSIMSFVSFASSPTDYGCRGRRLDSELSRELVRSGTPSTWSVWSTNGRRSEESLGQRSRASPTKVHWRRIRSTDRPADHRARGGRCEVRAYGWSGCHGGPSRGDTQCASPPSNVSAVTIRGRGKSGSLICPD